MKLKTNVSLGAMLLLCLNSIAQTPASKQLPANRTTKSVKIDRFINVDAVFTWQYAPGSFINLVWKNAAHDFNRVVEHSYFKYFDNTMSADDNNNLSLKVIYFLDYLQLKKKKKTD